MGHWIGREAKITELPALVVWLWLLHAICMMLVVPLLFAIGVEFPDQTERTMVMMTVSLGTLAARVFFEEIIFRTPLLIVIWLQKWLGRSLAVVLITSVVLSVLFGLVHGSIANIFTQGVGGLIWSVLFLKSGGMQGKFFKPIATATAAHFIWDAMLIAIVRLP
jgi:membrane-anchored protein YejM (alkaline phosphatase superfamily)